MIESPNACPLCGHLAHVGKCPRPDRSKAWCGLCLVANLSAADLAAPPFPFHFLQAARVARTSEWCHRCGTPVCDAHRHANRCEVDCRVRPTHRMEFLRTAVSKYNPGFKDAHRCVVCGNPQYRRAGRKGRPLCQRHYTQVRRGLPELTTERQRKWKGYKSKIVQVAVHPRLAEAALELADGDVSSLSKWVAELIRAEVARRKGTDILAAHLV